MCRTTTLLDIGVQLHELQADAGRQRINAYQRWDLNLVSLHCELEVLFGNTNMS